LTADIKNAMTYATSVMVSYVRIAESASTAVIVNTVPIVAVSFAKIAMSVKIAVYLPVKSVVYIHGADGLYNHMMKLIVSGHGLVVNVMPLKKKQMNIQ